MLPDQIPYAPEHGVWVVGGRLCAFCPA
jgi:hypothetical protein